MKKLIRCKFCDKPLRAHNESGFCSICWINHRTEIEKMRKNEKNS